MFAHLAPNLFRFFRPAEDHAASNRALTERIAHVFEEELDLADLPSLCFMVKDGVVHLYADELTSIQREVVHSALYSVNGVVLVAEEGHAAYLPLQRAA